MDESVMEKSISDYKEQLAQIEIVLCSCDEESRIELNHLKQDVIDLIKVTEESLLSLKKSRLLKELSADENKIDTEAPRKQINEKKPGDSSTDFFGIKCRVRYTFDWGLTEFHNAMVVGSEETSDDQHKIKVLFMNPTHKSMVPCSYFLEGKCKFTEDSCRFSHGYLADLHDVQEYIEPDFSKLEAGEKCLAKYEDDIWYKSTIREVYDDTIDVHYDTYDTDAKLDIHFVLPIETSHEESDSSSEYEIDDDNSRDVHEDNYVAQLSRQPLSSVGPLGEWEIHTKGIGSKLMAKMGYVFGKGLGKEGEGRVEPIEIVLLPAGKSLDKVAELRENGKLHKPLKKKKIKMESMIGEGCSSNQGGSSSEKSDVFAFINKKLTKQDSSLTDECDFEKQKVRHNIEDSYQQLKKNRERKRKGQSTKPEPNKGPNWNVQLLKNNEKASALRKQLSKHKESLKRNLGRDREMVNRLHGSISSIENELQELEKSGKTIENKLNSKAQHKKLTIF